MKMNPTDKGIDWLRLPEETREEIGQEAAEAARSCQRGCSGHYVSASGQEVCLQAAMRVVQRNGYRYRDVIPARKADVFEANVRQEA